MVILPTEKSFDWQHAPTVLISIVVLNILVFVFYQSGDNAKFESAFTTYNQNGLFEIEWPLYQDYLREQNEVELLESYEWDLEDGLYLNVFGAMLMDNGFQDFLKSQAPDLIKKDDDYFRWKNAKAEINKTIDSVSYLRFGLVPVDISPVSLITHQFLHGGLMHLIGNLFFLIICGFAVEAAIGHLRFLIFYLVTGVVGCLAHAWLNSDSSNPLIGASGAISGVMAMYLGVFRFKKIEFFYWFFIFVGYFRAPALLILPVYIGKELFSFFTDSESNVAFMAHAGGFIAGSALMAITLLVSPKKIDEEYVEEDQTTDPMQEKIAKVYSAIENYQFASAQKQVQLLIDEYGEKFDLIVLKYNLAKIEKPENFNDLIVNIFNSKGSSPEQRFQMQKIWDENPEIHSSLNDDTAVRLALNFSNPQQFDAAEALFKVLHERESQHPNLGLLARKLAQAAGSLELDTKKIRYNQFADSIKAV